MLLIATWITKLINKLINILDLGAGYTWPGHVALKIYPDIFNSSAFNFKDGVVLISGTNGKTTTAKLITHMLRQYGYKVVHNKSGANLLNGIVSAVLLDRSWLGFTDSTVGVFEVDELVLPSILTGLSPKVLVLLNLSRDQLDRYGEVDIILDKWATSVSSLDSGTALVMDLDQKRFKKIEKSFQGEVKYFDADARNVSSTRLRGEFNARNVNAAILVVSEFGVSSNEGVAALSDFDAAYGRGEVLKFGGKDFQIYLAKNPQSFNSNLNLLLEDFGSYDTLLFVLNDEIRDGRDVSWIYDINQKKLMNVCEKKKIFITGTRFLDFAVRLKYSGVEVDEKNIISGLKDAAKKVKNSKSSNNVVVLPNYSAMLEIRKVLTGREIL